MPSTERKRARWRGLTTRPSSGRSPGLENNNSYLNRVDQKSIKEAAERSRHLVQEQWVHEDWESGGALIKVLPKTLKKRPQGEYTRTAFPRTGGMQKRTAGPPLSCRLSSNSIGCM